MAWRTISVALQATTAGYTAGLAKASRSTLAYGQQVEGVQKRTGAGWGRMAKGAGIGLAILGGGLAASLGEAIKWESAFAGVRKTVDGSEAEFKALEDGLIGLANRLPQSREEIAGVAEAAGQLGIAKGDILEFTEVMVGLGTATNLSSEEAATGLAQFANIMQTSSKDYERLGSTLVDLGNKGASTESDILAMSLRLAGAGQVIGLTEADVLSLSNAMASMGIQSELGGGAFSRTMLKVYDAVESGGENLEAFAKVAGMTGEEFTKAFNDEPVKALDAIVVGLGNAEDSGANMVDVMKTLGINGTQERQVMLRLAGAGDLLTESIDNGSTAWSENTALADEASERYKTAESQLKIFGNQASNVARIVGAALIPMFLGTLDAAREFGSFVGDVASDVGGRLTGAFDDLIGAGENLADVFGAIFDVAGPLVGLFAKLVAGSIIAGITAIAAGAEALSGFLADNEALVKAATVALIAYGSVRAFPLLISGAQTFHQTLLLIQGAVKTNAAMSWATAFSGQLKIAATGAGQLATGVSGGTAMLKSGLMGAAGLIGPLGLGLAAVGAIGYLAFSRTEKGAKKAREEIKGLMAGLDTRTIKGLETLERELRGLASVNYDAIDQIGGIFSKTAAEEYEDAADRTAEALAKVRDQYKAVQTALREDLGVDYSIEALERFADAADLDPSKLGTKEFVEAMLEAKGAADAASPAAEGLGEAVEVIGNEASSATDRVDALKSALDELVDKPKSLFDAASAFGDGLRSLTEAVDEYGFSLDGMSEGGSAVRAELSGLVDDAKASAEAMLDNNFAPEVAVEELQKAEAAIRAIAEAAGLTGDPLDALLADLGLYEGTYEAFFAAETGDAEAAVAAARTAVEQYADIDATQYLQIDDQAALTSLTVLDERLGAYIASDPKAQAFLDISNPEERASALNGMALTWIQSDPTAKAYFDALDPTAKAAVLAAIARKWTTSNPTTKAYVDVSPALASLAVIERYKPKGISIPVYTTQMGDWSNLGKHYGGGSARPPGSRWGHVRAFAKGGLTAHVQHGEMYRYAEKETGGEALIPRFGDKRRSLAITKVAAGWNGYDIVPKQAQGMAQGGLVGPQLFPVRGPASGGVRMGDTIIEVHGNGDQAIAEVVRREVVPALDRNHRAFMQVMDKHARSSG